MSFQRIYQGIIVKSLLWLKNFIKQIPMKPLIKGFTNKKVDSQRYTYCTKTETRHQSLVKKTIWEKSNCRNSVDYSKNIIKLKWPLSWSMMWLQQFKFIFEQCIYGFTKISDYFDLFIHLNKIKIEQLIETFSNWEKMGRLVKNRKQTSCMCHKEACHRTSWAHLAQNSIPTWKIKHVQLNLISKINQFHSELRISHKTYSSTNWEGKCAKHFRPRNLSTTLSYKQPIQKIILK